MLQAQAVDVRMELDLRIGMLKVNIKFEGKYYFLTYIDSQFSLSPSPDYLLIRAIKEIESQPTCRLIKHFDQCNRYILVFLVLSSMAFNN